MGKMVSSFSVCGSTRNAVGICWITNCLLLLNLRSFKMSVDGQFFESVIVSFYIMVIESLGVLNHEEIRLGQILFQMKMKMNYSEY